MADLLCYCRHKPVVNEIEINPTLSQVEQLRFLKAQNIHAIAYTPICRLGIFENEAFWGDQRLEEICQAHQKSKTQVMLHWAVARGTTPIPRSSSLPHIKENIEIFDFVLTPEQMQTIDSLN